MKATGIVRRIDDLGRVVIPKEIRRTMRIREGDPLEIYTNREGEVIFKKYSPIGELTSFAAQYAEALHKSCNLDVIICDRDAVVAVAGVSKKEYMDKHLTSDMEKIMQGRSIYKGGSEDEKIYAVDGTENCVRYAMPIINDGGDVVGCVASLIGNEKKKESLSSDVELNLVVSAAVFLGKQMDA